MAEEKYFYYYACGLAPADYPSTISKKIEVDGMIFERHDEIKKAKFVIFDLRHPPADWVYVLMEKGINNIKFIAEGGCKCKEVQLDGDHIFHIPEVHKQEERRI